MNTPELIAAEPIEPNPASEASEKQLDEHERAEISRQFERVILELKGDSTDSAAETETAVEPLWLAAEIKAIGAIGRALAAENVFPNYRESVRIIAENMPSFGDEEHNRLWQQAVKYASLYALQQARFELPLT